MARACSYLRWAASGAMALTGHPGRPPVAPAAPVVARLEGVTAALRRHGVGDVDVGEALTGRAAMLGLARGGDVSANGTCRLLEGRDAWMAASLARPSDRELLDALVGHEVTGDPWDVVAEVAATQPTVDVVATARLLGLAVAILPVPVSGRPADHPTSRGTPGSGADPVAVLRDGGRPPPLPAVRSQRIAPRVAGRTADGLVVVDLSSLWAGPSCARLLGRAGATVIEVESSTRPEPRRDPAWWSWLHGTRERRRVDFSTSAGRAGLRALLAGADVVIEASRPRALAQLGLDPAGLALRPGCTWLSITGHGRSGEAGGWVGFGDDAAVAGGLVSWDGAAPVFCADAVADPATGLLAALAVLDAVARGGGVLLDVALAAVASWLATPDPTGCARHHAVRAGPSGWEAVCGSGDSAHVVPLLDPVVPA